MILPLLVVLCCLGVGIAVTLMITGVIDIRGGLQRHRAYIQSRDAQWGPAMEKNYDAIVAMDKKLEASHAEIITRLNRIEGK